MDPLFVLMKDLGNPQMTAEIRETIIEGVMEEAGSHSVKKLAKDENEMLIGLLSLRTKNAT